MPANLLWANLTIPPAAALNRVASRAAERQIEAAGSGTVVPLVYGQDRIGARILNVLKAADNTDVLVQALWCFAGDSVNDVRLNDLALPAGATITHYTGSQTTADSLLVAAFAAQSITYADTLNGYMYSVLRLPSAQFTGALKLTARIRGRRLYDPRKDSTAGGSGSHRLATPSTWEYSANPSLALADFLSNAVYGAAEGVIWSSAATCADANDATVGSPGEARRTLGISFLQPSELPAMVAALRAYAGCFILPEQAGHRLLPDADAASAASYSHAAGNIASLAPLALRDLGNRPTAVEVLFTNTSQIPWLEDSAVATMPGAGTTLPWRLSQVRMPGVQRYSQALREATERLNKLTVQDLSTSIEVFDIGVRHQVADIIDVTHPLGITAKKFRVVGIDMLALGRWRLQLLEHDPAAYSTTVATQPVYANTGYVISEGEGGLDGLSTYTATIYRQAAAQPSQAGGGSYTFEGDVFVPPPGTSREIPEAGTNPIWATSYTFQTRTPAVPVPGPAASADPHRSKVVLHVRADGANNSSNIVDSSPSPRTLNVDFTQAVISTEQSRFGGSSLKLTGFDHVLFDTFAGIEFGLGAFCVEAWVRPAVLTSPWSTVISCLASNTATPANRGWRVLISSTGQLAFSAFSDVTGHPTGGGAIASADNLVVVNQWQHVAITSDGSTLRGFVNGAQVLTSALSGGTNGILAPGSAVCRIGDTETGAFRYNGFIDELRVTKGEARYTAPFDPPYAAFPGNGAGGTGWPAWTRVLRDGAGGTNGIVVFAYQRSASGTPALPSATATYTFATATLTGLNNGWSATIPGGSDTLYVTAATARSAEATDTIPSSEWAAAQVLGGSGGGTAINSAPVLLFRRTNDATPPASVSGPVTWTFATGVATGLTNGWSQSLPTTGGSHRWVISATALGSGSTDVIAAAEFSDVALLAQDGAGADVIDISFSPAGLYPLASSTGFVPSYTGISTTASVRRNGTDETGSWSIAVESSTLATTSVSGAVISLTGIDQAVDTVALRVAFNRSGYAEQTRQLTVSKVRSLGDLGLTPLRTSGLNGTTTYTTDPVLGGIKVTSDGQVFMGFKIGTGPWSWSFPVNWYTPTSTGIGASYSVRVTEEWNYGPAALEAGTLGAGISLSSDVIYGWRVPLGPAGLNAGARVFLLNASGIAVDLTVVPLSFKINP